MSLERRSIASLIVTNAWIIPEIGMPTQGINQCERNMFHFEGYTGSKASKVSIIPQLQEKKDVVR